MKIKTTDKRLQNIQEINNICKRNNSPVMIYGATHTAKSIVRYLEDNGLEVSHFFVVDDDYIFEENSEDIMSFSSYIRNYAQISPLVFGFYNYEIIKEKKRKYSNSIPYMYDFHITVVNDVLVDWNYRFIKDNIKEFEELYDILSDYRSRFTLECYLNAAVAGEFDPLYEKCRDTVPYFNSVLEEVNVQKLFDCGAYDGDSIHDYINAYINYKEIYAFEPDKKNIEKIKQRIKNERIHDITIIDKGVWSETTTLHFSSDGNSSSCISENGDTAIDVIKLDDMYDRFDSHSLIKMDIEGSELEALKGAERIITKIHPALAICVYHKKEDLITIPQYIRGLVNEGTYRYHLGYQGLDLAELVFYAIPC